MTERDTNSWLMFAIRHIESHPEYTIDAIDIDIEMEVRNEGDEDGNTSEHQNWFVACSAHRVSYHGEGWGWDENDPHTVTWRNLRRELKRSVLLDCLEGINHLHPTQIDFVDDRNGTWYDINPKDYGIDINQYLYKEVANDNVVA